MPDIGYLEYHFVACNRDIARSFSQFLASFGSSLESALKSV